MDRTSELVQELVNEIKRSALESVSAVLGDGAPSNGRARRARRKARGKWQPGSPGRVPKWYLEQQKQRAKAKGK